jgi:hypothetical protein
MIAWVLAALPFLYALGGMIITIRSTIVRRERRIKGDLTR